MTGDTATLILPPAALAPQMEAVIWEDLRRTRNSQRKDTRIMRFHTPAARRAAIAVATALALSACNSDGSLRPQAAQAVAIACQFDGAAQPIGAATLATLVPQSTPFVALDNGLVHPAIVGYCKGLGASGAVAVAAPPAAPAKP